MTKTSVPLDHPSLPGHFPGHPVVPGVVLLDLVLDAIRAELGTTTRLQSIVSAKFLRAVAPATPLDLHIKLTSDAAGQVKARFAGTCALEPILEGSFLLAVEQAS